MKKLKKLFQITKTDDYERGRQDATEHALKEIKKTFQLMDFELNVLRMDHEETRPSKVSMDRMINLLEECNAGHLTRLELELHRGENTK